MATFNALVKGNKTFKDTTSVDAYNIGADALKVTIAGKMKGDTINVEGLASEYTVKASGRTVTLKSDTQTITFQLDSAAGAAKIVFLDGSLDASFNGKAAMLGSQKLSKKYAEVNETGLNEANTSSTAIDNAYNGTSGNVTVPGSTFSLTTAATDVVTGTDKSDAINAVASTDTTKDTYNTGDTIIDGATNDNDTLTITTNKDITATTTVKNIENINVKVDAITTGDTDFAFAATNIGANSKLSFDVVAPVTAVNSLTVTALDSQTINVGSAFTTASLTASATTKDITANVAAAGTVGSPVDLTVVSGQNVTVNAKGNVKVTAATATGLVNVTADKSINLASAAAASAVMAKSTGGSDVTLTDATAASLIQLQTDGNITATAATAIVAAKTLNLLAGGTVKATVTNGTLATATLAGTGVNNTLTDTAGNLAELNLSGSKGAATYTLASHAKLNTINVTGSNDVKIVADASKIGALTTTTGYGGAASTLAVKNASSGKASLKLDTAAGTADLSNSTGLNSVDLAISNATKTITLPSGTALTISAAQAGQTIIAGATATKATNSLAITLDDGDTSTGAADFVTTGELKLMALKNVTIDASKDTTAAGTSNAHAFFKLTGSDQNANVTINGGVNELQIADIASGAVNLGTGTLTVNGTGDVKVTHATGTLTAGGFDASSKTAGVVTAAALDLSKTAAFKTGAGDDVITVSAGASTGTPVVSTGAGKDKVTLKADFSAKNLSIDFGADSDTLILGTGSKISVGTGKAITLSNLETIQIDDATEISASLLSGKAYAVTDANGSGTSAVTVKVASTDSTIDLSTLAGSTASADKIATQVWTTDASTNTNAITIKGIANAKNVIKGGSGADSLVGGAKDDTIHAGSQDTVTGGTGKDTFNVSGAAGSTATKLVTITDFQVNDSSGAVDVIDLGTTGNALLNTLTGYTATGNVLTKTGGGGTLQGFIDAVVAAQGGNGFTAGDAYAFALAGDMYIYSTGATAASADDMLVKVVGVAQLGVDVVTGGTAGSIKVVL